MSCSISLYEGAANFYRIASSLINSDKVINTVSIACLPEVNRIASFVGMKMSAWTGGYIQLNNFVPQTIRKGLRTLGLKIVAPCIIKTANAITKYLGVNNDLARGVICAPIIEELFFRLPLCLIAHSIDTNSEGVLGKPILNAVDVTTGSALKGLAAILFSIGFTYGHNNNPTPARAAGLFSGGMALSGMTLRSGLLGVGIATFSHGMHNLRIKLGLSTGEEIDASREERSIQ